MTRYHCHDWKACSARANCYHSKLHSLIASCSLNRELLPDCACVPMKKGKKKHKAYTIEQIRATGKASEMCSIDVELANE